MAHRAVRVEFSAFALLLLAAACSSDPISADDAEGPGATGGAGSRPSGDGAPSFDEPPAPYPPGPYGYVRGATIQNLSFLGWRDPPASEFDPTRLDVVELADFYDPDGSKGVRVIALNASAVWCTVCRSEYRQLRARNTYAQYRPKGVEILGVIFEDANFEPAKPDDLEIWGGPDGFEVPFPLVIDPGFKIGTYFATDATPMNMLIDASTMRILDVTMGYDSQEPEAYWAEIDAWLEQ